MTADERTSDADVTQMKEDIRDVRNDIDKIKSDTHSINRVLVLADSETIKRDLTAVLGRSSLTAAVLLFTRGEVSRPQLAMNLGIDIRNLSKFVNPLLDKGYVTSTKRGREVFYRRAEIVDLVAYEGTQEFRNLVKPLLSKNPVTQR